MPQSVKSKQLLNSLHVGESRTGLDSTLWIPDYSHENKSRTEIRRETFLRAVLVLDKTCSCINGTVRVLFKTRLIFPRINGPTIIYISIIGVSITTKRVCKPKVDLTNLLLTSSGDWRGTMTGVFITTK